VLDIGTADVELLHFSFGGRWSGKIAGRDHLGNIFETGVGADGLTQLAHQLQAVVIGRVVAGGDHQPAVELVIEGGEVHAFRAAQPDVHHIHAGVGDAADQRLRELLAGETDIAADGDAPRIDEGRVRAPYLVDEIRIDFVGNAAADIVGLESGQVDHSGFPFD